MVLPSVPARTAPAWPWAGVVTWAGLAVVLTAAAILSFAALRDLAIAVRIDGRLAFLLPIAVDAGAAVSCSVWLSRTAHADARRFACGLTWSLLTLTVVGNAAQLGMEANDIVPPWWVAVAVGAVAPLVVGGVVHLAVLVGRTPEQPALTELPGGREVETGSTTLEVPDGGPGDPLEAQVRELVAAADQPVGRGTVMRELGVTEHQARKLLATVSANGAVTR